MRLRTLSFTLAFFLMNSIVAMAITVTRISSPVLYIDTASNVNPNLLANYVGYRIFNDTASTLPDVWVDISSFTGGVVSLAPYEDGVAHLGAIAAGASKTAFFYLQASGQTAVAQSHVISVYSTRPPAAAQSTAAFSLTVEETIAANANKVTTVVTTPNDPNLGALVVVTVTGATGTIGAAKQLSFSPATYLDWLATTFELYSTRITLSGGNTGTFDDQLLLPPASITSTSNTDYSSVYTFRATDTSSAPATVSPVGFISSGTQIKHTDTGQFGSLPPIPPVSNSLTLAKSATPTAFAPGGNTTFTLRVTNTSNSNDAILEDFRDTLPANLSYVSGSSQFAGSSVADPSVSGSVLTWIGSFSIPGGQSQDFTFRVTGNIAGAYTNSAVGHTGSAQIDTTLSTSDNSPATCSVSVGIPDLTISKSHSGNFSQGQSGATYTITVTNGGSGPTNGTVTATDSLPSGLTATAIGGDQGGAACWEP